MEGGAEAVIHLDYLRPEATAGHGDDRLRIAGTTGIVEVSHGISWLNTGGTWSELELYPPSRPMFADFLAQIEGRGSCKVTASDSFHITECCLQAQRSAESGIPIKIGLGGG